MFFLPDYREKVEALTNLDESVVPTLNIQP